MTLDQALLLALLGGLLAVFALDRWRIETVAIAGLSLACLLGLVPLRDALSGIVHPAVLTVGEVLLIVQALHGSHAVERIGRWMTARRLPDWQILCLLCLLGAVLSSVINNIGALALLVPVAFALSRSAGLDPRGLLMPLAFATLLGGLCTVVGTPANLIVSSALADARGSGFAFLDFLPTGALVVLAGIAALVPWSGRIFPLRAADAAGAPSTGGPRERLICEAVVADTPPTMSDLEERLAGRVISAWRGEKQLFPLTDRTILQPGDRLLVDGGAEELARLFAGGLLREHETREAAAADNIRVRAAVMPHSSLLGSRLGSIGDVEELSIDIRGLTTRADHHDSTLADIRLTAGDILHLSGPAEAIRMLVDDHGLLAISQDPAAAPSGHPASAPTLAIILAGIGVAALGLLPPEIALGAAVAALVVTGRLDLRAALRDLNWPIVLVLVATLPLGTAIETTGTAGMLAGGIASLLTPGETMAAAAVLLGAALVMTPLVNNATTAVVLAPIAIETAGALGVEPTALLMAVAIGASLDFLTPIGHHNNTLAYGLGGYRFIDFLRVGWPVTLATVGAGLAGLALFWT